MIKREWVLKQLKADLIGKDSYRGVSLTYSWLANQFGHFSLGFIPTIILYQFIQDIAYFENKVLSSSLLVCAFWLMFELYNFLWPLLKHFILKKSEVYVFKPAWFNVAFDTATDLLFFWIGAFSATLSISFQEGNMYILLFLLLLVIYPVIYWYQIKMYQNYAKFPMQFRLSQWKRSISKVDKEKIKMFLNSEENGKHLLIFGSKRSGKTSLGVALANEKAIKHKTSYYTTSIKLFSMFFEDNIDSSDLWNWRTTSYLIIDDLNPGGVIKDQLVTDEMFLKYIDTYTIQNEKNRSILKNKNVIWILGNLEQNISSKWTNMLLEIGIEDSKIQRVDLSS